MMHKNKHTLDIRVWETYLIPTPAFALLLVLAIMLLRMFSVGFCYSSLVETLVSVYTSVFFFNYGKQIYNKCKVLFRRCRKRFYTVD